MSGLHGTDRSRSATPDPPVPCATSASGSQVVRSRLRSPRMRSLTRDAIEIARMVIERANERP